jgi:3-hydroxyisobutyrate dehydrogenase-like beta-hydroxyacid dehydrogenase
MMPQRKLGLIGLGAIGQIYAGHLLRANGALTVFDVLPEKMRQAQAAGAAPAASPKALAAQCDFVLLALPSPEAVRATLLGPEGVLAGAQPGLIIIDTSTIDPDTCRDLYAAAQARGVDYLEAPVSGGEPGGAGTDGARAANISFMVGGDAAAFERARPVMSILGKRFFHLGPAGSGSTVKLISNLMAGLHNLVATEAFVLGAAAGFSPETLLEVFDGTDARSFWLTEYFAPRLRRKDFEPGFSVDLQYKDHRLAADLARQLKVPLLLNEVAVQVYQMLRAQGLGGKDLVEAVNLWGQLANADIYHPRERAEGM